jgi:hypothetical protein
MAQYRRSALLTFSVAKKVKLLIPRLFSAVFTTIRPT